MSKIDDFPHDENPDEEWDETEDHEDEEDDDDERRYGDDCPICGQFNSPPADETCTHICAWVWDGETETLGEGRILRAALDRLESFVEFGQSDDAVIDRLNSASASSHDLGVLIGGARGYLPMSEILLDLDGIAAGQGWTSGGMLGGSGRNFYVKTDGSLAALAAECDAISTDAPD